MRTGAVATPRSDRWHLRPVPILGGLAIAGGVLAGAAFLGPGTHDLLAVLVGMAVMAALGLIDDLGYVPPLRRVLVEAVTAAAFAWAVTTQLDAPIRAAAILLATICLPVAINAVNLVDNTDGLASLLSTLTAVTLAAIVAVVGIPGDAGSIALVIAAACVGFLVHNRPPARVFMGDSGSLMLGIRPRRLLRADRPRRGPRAGLLALRGGDGRAACLGAPVRRPRDGLRHPPPAGRFAVPR